jgi:aryl-alcohol dehydrogenase-like predicted oxidoreductase
MRYKLLGSSGLRVSELALGTMTFGTDWGWGADRDEARRIFTHYAEAGGNFIDTACNYTNGSSEEFVGDFISGARARYVVATKYTLTKDPTDPNAGGNSRKSMVQTLEGSLRRLGTDYVDLFWLHAWDALTPVEEIMRGLDDLVRAGKVLYVGVSDTPAWVISRANMLAELRGWSPFVAVQVPYNLLNRDIEHEIVPMAAALQLTITPWGLLSGGKLTGKYSGGAAASTQRDSETVVTEHERPIIELVMQIAAEIGCTPSQVAVAWVRQQRPAAMLPIIGARTAAQVADNLAVLNVTLSKDQLARLDAASRPTPIFPGEFLAGDTVQNLIFGQSRGRIDSHRA